MKAFQKRSVAATGFGGGHCGGHFHRSGEFVPWDDFIHGFQKLFSLGFLFPEAVFDVCKCFLFHIPHRHCFFFYYTILWRLWLQ
jgi:hypothetical protein